MREHFESHGKDTPVAPPALAEPRPVTGSPKRPKPLQVIQPGWTWENVTLEVAAARRVIFCCGDQRKEYRFPKRNGKKHSEGYAILMKIAANPEWHNPRSWEANHEATRRRFIRLKKDLIALLPIPGRPFKKDNKAWRPAFSICFHTSLTSSIREASSQGRKQDAVDSFPPVDGAYFDCHQ